MGASGSRSEEPMLDGSQVLLPGGKIHVYTEVVTAGQVMHDFPGYFVTSSILNSSNKRLRTHKVLQPHRLYVLRAKRDFVGGSDSRQEWMQDPSLLAMLQKEATSRISTGAGGLRRTDSGCFEYEEIEAAGSRASSQDSAMSPSWDQPVPSHRRSQSRSSRGYDSICVNIPQEFLTSEINHWTGASSDTATHGSGVPDAPMSPKEFMEAVLKSMDCCDSDSEDEAEEPWEDSEDSGDSSGDSSMDSFESLDSDSSSDGAEDEASCPPVEDRQAQFLAYLRHQVERGGSSLGSGRKWRPSLDVITEAEAVAIREGVGHRLGGRAKMRLRNAKVDRGEE